MILTTWVLSVVLVITLHYLAGFFQNLNLLIYKLHYRNLEIENVGGNVYLVNNYIVI